MVRDGNLRYCGLCLQGGFRCVGWGCIVRWVWGGGFRGVGVCGVLGSPFGECSGLASSSTFFLGALLVPRLVLRTLNSIRAGKWPTQSGPKVDPQNEAVRKPPPRPGRANDEQSGFQAKLESSTIDHSGSQN
jgi:hypothetical protein